MARPFEWERKIGREEKGTKTRWWGGEKVRANDKYIRC